MTATEDRARTIFMAALDRAPDGWPAFLDEACGGDAELRARVGQLLDAHQAMGSIHGAGADAPTAAADMTAANAPGTVIGPYKLVEVIGEGGMGTVYLAQQTEPVKRLVALKVVKAGMDSRQVIARFEAERQALALMDHPNIAKVFDAGVAPDGRPFFAMELVKGVPITKYCDEHRLTPRQRLELFVPVCQAVQHAHQKGIIHRDLKPSNVLAAPYDGRPVAKVIDFGVAKAAGQPLTEKTLFTGLGAVVGTPEYMSPEQAELNNADIDTRSDIYSLGVLLYELLTGTTPLTKRRVKEAAFLEVLRVIREEEPPKPSTRLSTTEELPSISAQRQTEPAKLARLVRGELDWIVMKALEKDRTRRYETANGLAIDVQRYLADEPVLACPPSAGYRLRKFARRNKRPLATAALLVVALLVTVGGIAWSIGWANRDRAAREAAAEQEATLALKEAERWQEQRKWPEALSAAKRAQGLSAGGGSEALRERIRELRRDVEMVLRLEDARLQSLESAKDGKGWNDDAQDAAYLSAFRDYGIDVEALPAEQAAERIRARPVHLELAGALDHWALRASTPRRNKLIAIARAVDSDEWRNRVRDALWAGQGGHAVLTELAASEKVRALPPVTVNVLAGAVRRAGLLDDAVALLRDAQQRHPDDFWINFELAFCLAEKRPPSWDEAVRFYSVALALRPGSLATLNNLARALVNNRRPDEAIPYCWKAIAVDPKYAKVHNILGNALRGQKKLDEAIASHRKAIELDPKSSAAHTGLGNALRDQKKPEEAVAEYRKAIELDPKDANPHISLGNALADQKKPDEAIAEYRKAIELDPKDARPHNNLGLVLTSQGKLDEAIAECRKAIELDSGFAMAHCNLGNALRDQKKLDEAVAEFRKAIELDPSFAMAHYNLGNALRNQKKLDEAVAECRKAIELDPKDPIPHNNLGNALDDQNKLDEAIAHFKKAIELDPKAANPHNGLGNALEAQKKLDEAIAEYRKAIELDPTFAMPHTNLGRVLLDQGRRDEAMAHFKKAIELDLKDEVPHFWLGNALKAQGKLEAAVASYKKAIELDPKAAWAHNGLAQALLDLERFDESIVSSRKAIELDPTVAAAHGNLGVALSNKRQFDEAIACLRKAIELDPKNAYAHYNLGCALEGKLQFDEAIASFRKAVEADPKNVSWRCILGKTLWWTGHPAEAVDCLRKAIELDPKHADAHSLLGSVLRHLGREEEAVASLRKAIELDASHRDANLTLAQILHARGEVDLALTHYQKAAEKLEPPANKAMPYADLARGYQSQGKLDEAIASYKKAIELDPSYAPAHMNLAELFLTKGEVDLALTHYQKAAEKHEPPANKALPYSWLGGGYQSQGKWAEAAASYKKAIELDPNNSGFHISLGFALQSQGKWDEAIACYRRAVEIAPKSAGSHSTLAWALATCADPKLRDPAGALRHAETCFELSPKYRFGWQSLAWARYRTGDWKGAVAAMTKVTELGSKGNSNVWFLLAMAHWKLGDECEARRWYDKAVEWMDKNQPENKELRCFRAEAAELLRVAVEVGPPPREKK